MAFNDILGNCNPLVSRFGKSPIKLFTISCLFLGMPFPINAQLSQPVAVPEIGKPCPDFVLKDVQHSVEKKITLASLRGQNVILDFFSTGCVICVKSWPSTNALQKKFAGKVKVILVGREDKYIKVMHEKYRDKYKLSLPVAYDSTLCNDWKYYAFPKVVWIDKNGIVKAVTSTVDLYEANVDAFIEGNSFEYTDISANVAATNEKSFIKALSAQSDQDSTDYLFFSKLSEWNGKGRNKPPVQLGTDVNNGKVRVIAYGVMLGRLYTFSQFGHYSWNYGDSLYGKVSLNPILEIKDPSPFSFSFTRDSLHGLYNYMLSIPAKNNYPSRIMKVLQNELYNYFGYSTAVETRVFPCWKLVRLTNEIEKLRNQGAPYSYKGTHAGFTVTNYPVKKILQRIAGYHQNQPVFIDETNFDFNIDFTFDVLMTDFNEVKKALNALGLDLVKGEVNMQVVVIRD